MYCQSRIAAAAIIMLLSTCHAETDAGASNPKTPVATPHVQMSEASLPAGASKDQIQNTNSGASTMEKECGGAQLQLIVEGPGSSRSTSLRMTSPEGKAIDIAKPLEMSTYTAVGMGCATSNDNQPYFVVQYGELPYGCSFCEWYYLYDAHGKQLTRSEPALLKDESLPEREAQYANNREYEALMKKLGLNQPELAYVQ